MRAAVAVLGVLWVASCGGGEPACVPNEQHACTCTSGAAGAQSCAADGKSFLACDCEPDAGVPVDASEPVDASASVDGAVPPDFAPPSCGCAAPTSCVDGGCGGCSMYGVVTGPASGTLGGQRAFDAQGYLYIDVFSAGLVRVPPGGGTVQVLVTNTQASYLGTGGVPFVEAGGTVLYQAQGAVMRYNPATQTSTTFAAATAAGGTNDNYGEGILEDSAGHVLVLRKGLVFNASDGSPATTRQSWILDYMVLTPTWVYNVGATRNYLLRTCFDGGGGELWGSGITDAYGLAVDGGGTLYFSQGNTNPATVFKVPWSGGAAQAVTTVPSNVLALAIDPSGQAVYTAGGNDATIWKIDTTTGAKVVYGCDPASTHHCGDTM
jgi:hypothetical protein